MRPEEPSLFDDFCLLGTGVAFGVGFFFVLAYDVAMFLVRLPFRAFRRFKR